MGYLDIFSSNIISTAVESATVVRNLGVKAVFPYKLQLVFRNDLTAFWQFLETYPVTTFHGEKTGYIFHYGDVYKSPSVDGFFKIRIGNYLILASCTEHEEKKNYSSVSKNTLVLYFPNKESKTAVEQIIQKWVSEHYDTAYEPGLYNYKEYDGWIRSARNYPRRTLNSVFIESNTKDAILNSIVEYEANADLYEQKQVPRHFGLCLTGPPGVGKSSLIAALATHFGKNIYLANQDIMNRTSTLIDVIDNIKPDSMFVIEDIDSFAAAQSRDKEGPKKDKEASLSTLLNALDGIATPKGLFFVITTNRYEDLDEALRRPGRITLSVEMSYLNQELFQDILDYYFYPGFQSGIDVTGRNIPPAAVTNLCASYLAKPQLAVEALTAYLDANYPVEVNNEFTVTTN